MILYILMILLFFIIYIWLKQIHFWRNKGIKGPLPMPVVGNFGNILLAKQSIDTFTKTMYDRYPNEKFVGVYVGSKPGLLVRDPVLIKQIMIKDFHCFNDRGLKVTETGISDNLFFAIGDTWKTLRPKLTPVFTTKKLKEIFPLMKPCADNLVNYIDNLIERNIDHEIKNLMSKYTISVIGSCFFDFDFNVYSDQIKSIERIADISINPSIYVRLCYALDYIFPGINNHLPVIDSTKDLVKYFMKLTNTIFSNRKWIISSKKDFVDILLQLKKDGKASISGKKGLTEITIDDITIAAQVYLFYIAGYESSSSTMSFLLHELALNEDIQNRAYEEICNVSKKYNDEINFESLDDMTYLKMIFDETLRKYPVVGTTTRKSTTDYILPESNITIEKGTLILISILGLHRDSKYFPDPDNFNPEQFSRDCKAKYLSENIYIPFGAGPRQCLGYTRRCFATKKTKNVNSYSCTTREYIASTI